VILILGEVAGVTVESLLARSEGKRGPVASIDSLGELRENDKLHLVAPFADGAVAGYDAVALVELLTRPFAGGLPRLKQIHLISPFTGCGGETSFAAQLDAALQRRSWEVDEIKAPIGDVRSESEGKIWVRPEGGNWTPSSPALNYYAGPRVAEKHRA